MSKQPPRRTPTPTNGPAAPRHNRRESQMQLRIPRIARIPGPAAGRPMWRRARPLTAAALALTVIAAGFAVWAGSSWYGAAHEDSLAFARTRDRALAAGEQGVQNLNTLDWATVDRGLDTWLDSTTGDLHDQLAQGRAAFRKQVEQARTVTTAKILSAAVTELDDRAGRASVMVAVRITVRPDKGKPADKDSRMLAQLTRAQGGWKLSGLGQAPTGESAAAPSTTPPTPSTTPTTGR